MTSGDSARSATGGLNAGAAHRACDLTSRRSGGLVVRARIPAGQGDLPAGNQAPVPGFVVHVRIPAERRRALESAATRAVS
ncbi:hypothetical protein JK358_30040 [Nocardia sp. 2]|uniref:Uncharacterized protein n=1 Tax=Nocardia acididurans TaxID=2802282 RepID=A0ABS1MDK5_9NOCA|nr:hypothetical protein [Nocardia acididurans]MBL1078652.1 hypothetical protein [Nocardia acididurans]